MPTVHPVDANTFTFQQTRPVFCFLAVCVIAFADPTPSNFRCHDDGHAAHHAHFKIGRCDIKTVDFYQKFCSTFSGWSLSGAYEEFSFYRDLVCNIRSSARFAAFSTFSQHGARCRSNSDNNNSSIGQTSRVESRNAFPPPRDQSFVHSNGTRLSHVYCSSMHVAWEYSLASQI